MNVTRVEADDAMSVFSSASSNGAARWDWEVDENGTAGLLPDKAGEAPFDCSTVTCGSGFADLERTKSTAVTQKNPTNRPRNNRHNSSSRMEFATSASVVGNGCALILRRNVAQSTSLNDWGQMKLGSRLSALAGAARNSKA